MSYLKFIISLLVLVGLIAILNSPIKIGESSIPPLGEFINPFSGFWYNAHSLNDQNHNVVSEHLSDPVSIIYDERKVPHIYASNLEDLLFAQGYAMASERLWQMDITTRSVEGRTSEIFGERTLEQDKRTRRMGLPRSARTAVKSWEENEKGMSYIDAFSSGINHYINQLKPKDYPIEFKLLDYEPEKWSPYKTALFIKAMARTLNSIHTDDAQSNALNLLGEEKYWDLFPEFNKKQSPIIKKNNWGNQKISSLSYKSSLEKIYPTDKRAMPIIHVGSNNWAISGKKSKTGNAFLANDPHLGLTLPSIWIEMHLVCPEFNAYGVSLPAMPGITLGFNQYIAWGQTNAGHDVLDLYTIKWVDDTKQQYYLDGEIKDTEIVIEEYDVKGTESKMDTVRYTYWGPVRKENDGTEYLAQRWLTHDSPPSDEVEIYLNINKSKNYNEFKNVISSFFAPAQNFVFSSIDGDIAMIVGGKLPLKDDKQGKFIQDGSDTKNAWNGFIPFEDQPQELNPEQNYVSSANQHPTYPNYPNYYNGGFEDYRGRYLSYQLDRLDGVEAEDMMNLQLDNYSLKAEESLPYFLKFIDKSQLSDKELEVYNLLSKWNFRYDGDAEEPYYFERLWREVYRNTFDEILSLRENNNVPLPEEFRLIEMLEDQNNHSIFDIEKTEHIETREDIINAAFLSLNIDSLDHKNWSDEKNTAIFHLTNIPAFSIQNITSGGHRNTLNAIGKSFGPSWRMVVEMSNPIKAFGIYPGGQSGNPASPHYANFINDWAEGKYYNLNHSSDPKDIKGDIQVDFKPKK